MARESFAIDIGGIADPVSGGAATMEAAGSALQAAAATKGKVAAEQISFAGDVALEAGKGYLRAKQAKEMLGVAQSLTTEEDALKKLTGFADESAGKLIDDPSVAQVRKFQSEAAKLQQGIQQGVLTREEALVRMGAVTRKYIAMMPGWASEFRQVAANATGISNLDTWGIQRALADEQRRSSQKDYQLKIQQEQDQAIVQWRGYSAVDQITPQDRRDFQATRTREAAVKAAEDKAKLTNLTGDQRFQIAGEHTARLQQVAAAELHTMARDFLESNKGTTVEDKRQSDALRLQLIDRSAALEAQTEAQIRQMGVKSENNPIPLTQERVESLLKSNRELFDRVRKGWDSAAGVNLFGQLVRNTKDNADLGISMWEVHNPTMQVMGKLGVAPRLAELHIQTHGNVDAMAEIVGRPLAEATAKAFASPGDAKATANAIEKVESGALSEDEAARAFGPDAVKLVNTNTALTLRALGGRAKGGQELDEKSVEWAAQNVSRLGEKNLNVPGNRAVFDRLVQDGTISALADRMDPMQREKALGPVARRIVSSMPDNVSRLENMAYQTGAVLQIDGVTGRVMAAPFEGRGSIDPDLKAAVGIYNNNLQFLEQAKDKLPEGVIDPQIRQRSADMLAIQAEARRDMAKQQQEEYLKKQREVVLPGGAKLPPTKAGVGSEAEIAQATLDGVSRKVEAPAVDIKTAGELRAFEMRQSAGATTGEAQATTVVAPTIGESRKAAVSPADARRAENASLVGMPEAEAQAVVEERQKQLQANTKLVSAAAVDNGIPAGMLVAQMHAESGGDAMAQSSHAQGLMQIKPDTKADIEKLLGREIDPFDAKDSAEAGAAYMKWLMERPSVDGDKVKALAAYNWGIGNLQKYGLEDAPYETRAYVRRITGTDPWPTKDKGKKVPGNSKWKESPAAWLKAAPAAAPASKQVPAGTETSTIGVRG